MLFVVNCKLFILLEDDQLKMHQAEILKSLNQQMYVDVTLNNT